MRKEAVTQWFTCKNPPVNKGQYEMKATFLIHPKRQHEFYDCYFIKGKWFGHRGKKQKMESLDAIDHHPGLYLWRGLADKPKQGK